MLPARSPLPTAEAGFTLIELMVTLAIAAVLAMLAAPSIRDFIVRSQMTNLGNEFNASILKARNEAVNRNTCVTVCMSSSAANASPACTTSGNDWQAGWIVFLNPSCDTGLNKPSEDINMLLALGLFVYKFGFGQSILSAGLTLGLLILPVDQDTDPYLLAVDAKTGKQRWKVSRYIRAKCI